MKKTEDFLSCLRLAKLIKARGQGRYKKQIPFLLITTVIKNDRCYESLFARRRRPTRRAYHPPQILEESTFTAVGINLRNLRINFLEASPEKSFQQSSPQFHP
jgi:hypothetical protein